MRLRFIGPALAGVLGLSAFVWNADSAPENSHAETYQQLDLFAEILARVQTEYVTGVDEAEVMEASIDGMLTSLDPHSSYLNPEEYRSMQVQASGEYGGLGIEITQQDGFILVVSPMDDTPASRAGIQPGDYISAINGEPIVGQPMNDSLKEMRGAPGTDILLTILRENEEPFDVSLTREIIKQNSVSFHTEDTIGYIRISSFNEQTTDGVNDALTALKKELGTKMSGLILDLRNNPGGLLNQAVGVSSAFLDGGEVVSTRGRHPNDVQRYNARQGERVEGLPIIVLINGGSASAAEIVAGALQDHNRATILGEISFGKGSVQSVIPLGPQRGAIRLTTSRYYTPSNASIQGAGIEPDIEVAQTRLSDEEMEHIEKRQKRYSEANLRNALENDQGRERRPPHIPNDQPPVGYSGEDYQLERALTKLRSMDFASDLSQKG
ncbi:carboxyl-terminal protease [Hirschia baltica ATCC 49814]|uniref:Carboxyl-terminal protease n=2 Tax=Hirschia TaxID=2723 RepID=C6XL32_HIRBI|nr:carboxyl-terminal protease [Hirschia baltica ATCC 49814]